MKEVICISDNIVSPLGWTSEENFQAVRAGRSGLRMHSGTFGVRQDFCASLFDREALLQRAEEAGIRGYSPVESAALLSAGQAVEASGIDPASPRTAWVLSLIKGNVEQLGSGADVSLARIGRRVADYFGHPGPVTLISNACISGLAALIQARRMLLSGVCDQAVVVGAECHSRFTVTGFQSLKALSPKPCKPFDKQRRGLNLGEAAATLVLRATDTVRDNDWCIGEGAVRNDANHISAPSRVGEGSFRALRYALEGYSRDELAFVSVHGTGTLFNDAMEAAALHRAGLSDLPLTALKGYFGHTMGAAGVLEAILSMRSADAGVILGSRGFESLGVEWPVSISASERTTDKKNFVKLLSGFGGCNAACVFQKGGRK